MLAPTSRVQSALVARNCLDTYSGAPRSAQHRLSRQHDDPSPPVSTAATKVNLLAISSLHWPNGATQDAETAPPTERADRLWPSHSLP